MNCRKVIGKITIVLGVVFVLYSGVLLVKNELDDKNAREYSEDVVTKINQQIESLVLEENGFYEEVETENRQTMEIDGNRYIGLLEMPSLGIVLPIQKDWSYAKLDNTPCVYQNSPLVIAAHNYYHHFGRINRLAIGEQIKFTDVEGGTDVYQVMHKEILDDTNVSEMKKTEYDMTLFTCNYDDTQRVVVRLNEVK